MPPKHDRWVKSIAKGGNIVATAIHATDLVNEARMRHVLGQSEAKALGEAMLAALLLASTCKQGEHVSLSVRGDKYLRQAIADADPSGTVRGFITTREGAEKPDTALGPWQQGLLTVVRLKLNQKEPYTGTVPIVTGHLAKDLTFYLSQSEQIPSAVGLTVNAAADGSIRSAGAFLVQVMPGASTDEVRLIESNLNSMERLAAQVAAHDDPTYLLGQVFNDMTFLLLEEKPLRFECGCSRERVGKALKLLGENELRDMIAKDKGAQIRCDFCGKQYDFSDSELESLLIGRVDA